ncbi:MAG: hypothetical protein GY697_19330 [Desulfobacterales bacterium]|nr:hypothetical protein [Desulfobacterales bacterium]
MPVLQEQKPVIACIEDQQVVDKILSHLKKKEQPKAGSRVAIGFFDIYSKIIHEDVKNTWGDPGSWRLSK